MNRNRFEDCTLAVIAGGRGTRLGGMVKARLRDPTGRPLLQRTLDIVGPLAAQAIVVANDAAVIHAPPSVTVIPDRIADRGSPGGVFSACKFAKTEWVLALATDMPFVSPDVLRLLWAERDGVDVVTASIQEGRIEPLHAFYRAKTCARAFGPMLREGGFGFIRLLNGLRVRVVTAEELARARADLRSFENINTPEDLQRAELSPPED